MTTAEHPASQEHADLLAQIEREQDAAARFMDATHKADRTFHALIGTLPIGVVVCDDTGVITFSNPAASAILESVPTGNPFGAQGRYTLHRPDGSPFPAEELPHTCAIVRGEATRDVEILLRREDGKQLAIRVVAGPVRDERGAITGAVTAFQDITEQKRIDTTLRTLHAIATDPTLNFEEKLSRLLTMGCDQYELPIGILSRINGDTYTVVGVMAPDDSITKGSTFALGHTYCCDTIKSSEPVCMEHVGASAWKAHPCYTRFRLEAYIAMPVVVAGKVYGTINFSSPQPRTVHFTATDREVLKLMAQWAGSEIERRQADEALEVHARQQAAASELGLRALAGADLDTLMHQAVMLTSQALGVEYADVMEYLPEQDRLLLRSGVGWKPGLVGNAAVCTGTSSQAGYTLLSNEPVVVEDTPTETRFSVSPVLIDHGVASSVSVVIHGEQHPFGVLCAHAVKRRRFSRNDVHFLQTVANILATANQRNRAEEALRLRDRAIAAASEGILITDPRQPDNPIIYVNAGFERLTGYTSAEAIGRNCRFLGGPEADPATVDQMRRAVRVGRECTVEVLNYRKDGTAFWNRVSISPVRDACGRLTHFVGVLTDITERKEVERMKREFISTVSHELRTPLTSICGSLGLVRGDVVGELPVQAKGLVKIAYRNSERLVRLVNDILDIDRLEDGRMAFQPRPVALLPLVETALDLNRAYAESMRVALVLHQALPGAKAYVDPDRIIQVMTNLLSNAAKFSPPEGTVSVSMARRGHYIRLAVADNGPGIPDEFRDRIFERFAQADTSDSRQRGGTGLGLHIAKAIVEESGGNIGFESRIGGGTLFYCDLPEWKEDD